MDAKTYTAEQLNAVLRDDGYVQVTTHLRSTLYSARHAGWFTQGKDGNLYVRRGRTKDCLSMDEGRRLLVAIRLGQ